MFCLRPEILVGYQAGHRWGKEVLRAKAMPTSICRCSVVPGALTPIVCSTVPVEEIEESLPKVFGFFYVRGVPAIQIYRLVRALVSLIRLKYLMHLGNYPLRRVLVLTWPAARHYSQIDSLLISS